MGPSGILQFIYPSIVFLVNIIPPDTLTSLYTPQNHVQVALRSRARLSYHDFVCRGPGVSRMWCFLVTGRLGVGEYPLKAHLLRLGKIRQGERSSQEASTPRVFPIKT